MARSRQAGEPENAAVLGQFILRNLWIPSEPGRNGGPAGQLPKRKWEPLSGFEPHRHPSLLDKKGYFPRRELREIYLRTLNFWVIICEGAVLLARL